jgi:hypothetical protein
MDMSDRARVCGETLGSHAGEIVGEGESTTTLFTKQHDEPTLFVPISSPNHDTS